MKLSAMAIVLVVMPWAMLALPLSPLQRACVYFLAALVLSIAYPRCCERYLSPGPQLSDGSSLSVTPGASGAANPTDGDRQ